MNIRKFNDPIKFLTCCCCGSTTKGRQWWDRDTGYGICKDCVKSQALRESPETIKEYYGTQGVHYDVN